MQNKYISINNINNENILMSNINLVRLVALILVVLGHSTASYTKSWVYSANVNSSLYNFLSIYVSSFHLSVFVFASGLTYAYKQKSGHAYSSYLILIKKKLKRLILPYVFIGSLYMIPIGMLLNISRYNKSYLDNLKGFILGYSNGHLWYLFMLFNVFLAYYFIEKKLNSRKNIIIVTIILIVGKIVSKQIPDFFEINSMMNYLIVFHLGYCTYLYKYKISLLTRNILGKHKVITLVSSILIISLILLIKSKVPYIYGVTSCIYSIIDIIICIIGIVQVYSIVLIINKSKYLNYAKRINKYNFNIYLLHEPIIFIILSYLLPLNINPTIVVFLCFSLSIIISIIISKCYYYFINYLNKNFKYKLKISKFEETIKN